MERYPEYRFLATQTQQYRWLEQLYPDVFKNVQDKVKAGTWGEFDHYYSATGCN